MIDYVSISAYDDADLLRGAIESIRQHCPDATVAVVDGRYETWPADHDNSADDTPLVARTRADAYHRDGPYPREADKHRHRVSLAPEGAFVLFMDADERLEHVDPDALPRATAFRPRIANALVYGPRSVYWPRAFDPEWVESINRWDAYLFSTPCERTDAITLLHRHDLRDREYREAKLERFDAEGRTSRYEARDDATPDRIDAYLADDWDADFDACPRCGSESLTRTQLTSEGVDTQTCVEVCVRADGCFSDLRAYDPGEWQYLPEDWERGIDEDPTQLRAELLDAGCPFVATTGEQFLRAARAAIGLWIEDELGEGEPEVFA